MKDLRSVWRNIKEYELIEMLVEVLERMQNHVEVPHISDPSHEGGVDILTKDPAGKVTAWCVKIKPRLVDLGQLTQFASVSADRHLYLYVRDATRSFKSEAQKERYQHIEFWNWNRVTRFLIEQDSGLFFGRIFWNSKMISQIIYILSIVAEAERLDSLEYLPEISEDEILRWLWNFKDRSVLVTTYLNVLYGIFKDHAKKMNIDNYSLVKLILAQLDSIEEYHLQGITSLMQQAVKKPLILKLLYESVKPSSVWAFMLEDIRRYKQEKEKRNKEHYLQRMRSQIVGYLQESNLLEAAEHHSYRLFRAAQAFEIGADLTFDKFLQMYKQRQQSTE